MHDYPLEPVAAEMRALTERVLELLLTEIERLDESPAAGDAPDDDLLADVSRPPPEAPQPAGPLLDIVSRAAARSYQTAQRLDPANKTVAPKLKLVSAVPVQPAPRPPARPAGGNPR